MILIASMAILAVGTLAGERRRRRTGV